MENANKNSKTIVIIPAYEPPSSFIEYSRKLIETGFGGVVVVNDGSNSKYDSVFDEIAAIDGCTVISYGENHGKGYALKTAFKYCKETYNESYVFVTADCDGQHLVKDVGNVALTAWDHQNKLILGSRDFSLEHVPPRSRAGNVNIRRMFKFFYGLSLSDTQTGLRACSYSLLDKLIEIKGDRFEYEMNMLIILHKSHFKILEVPIETVYDGKAEDVDKVSHFKTFRDSVKVLGTLFQNLGWYVISSVLSAVIDIVAFFILANYVPVAMNVLFATVTARIISSIVNFTINFKVVFNGKSRKAIFKYYILWTLQLATSYGLATFANFLFGSVISGLGETQINLFTTLFKGFFDLLLALISYQIQSRWVFASVEYTRLNFYGPYFRFARSIYNIFNRKYRSFVIPDEKEPSVYVIRHLNMVGPHKIMQNLGFDVHVFVLSPFFKFKTCYHHYSTYTFTEKLGKRGFGKLIGKIKAFFAAIAVVPGVRSVRAIPVYRGGAECVTTFKIATKYLDKRENVALFPDIDYTTDDHSYSNIYTGFLYLDKLYFKKHGKHLSFRIIKIDNEKEELHETACIRFPDGEFKDSFELVSEQIKNSLMSE